MATTKLNTHVNINVKTFVLSGTHKQYINWKRLYCNRDTDSDYLGDRFFSQTCGFICDEARILLVGTWSDRSDVPYIIFYARQRGLKICVHYDGHEIERLEHERRI